MSKVIKVEGQVYAALEKLRGKGETFSDAIGALLDTRIKVLELISVLEGQIKYREWQEDRRRQLETLQEGG